MLLLVKEHHQGLGGPGSAGLVVELDNLKGFYPTLMTLWWLKHSCPSDIGECKMLLIHFWIQTKAIMSSKVLPLQELGGKVTPEPISEALFAVVVRDVSVPWEGLCYSKSRDTKLSTPK